MAFWGINLVKSEPTDALIPDVGAMDVDDRPPKRRRLMVMVVVPTLREVNELRRRAKLVRD